MTAALAPLEIRGPSALWSAIPVCIGLTDTTRLFFAGFLRGYCAVPTPVGGGGRVERHLVWPDLLNARDLGGLLSAAGEQTARRRVVRADNLNRLAPAGVAALISYGVRTVIDLRDPRELERFPNPLAEAPPQEVVFVNVPLISAAEWEAIKDPERMAEGYVLTAKLSHANIARAIAAIAEASPGGVVIHCHAGKERTGIVAALLLSLAGVPDTTVADDWVASDAYLQPLYEEWLANETDPTIRAKRAEGFVTHAEYIVDVLTYVRVSHGSLEEYLLAGGLRVDQLDRARSRLAVSSGGRTPRNVA
jgi:protein tyrosine/serine phosphatase